MWIFSREKGLFNLDFVSRITADKNGTYLSVDGKIYCICNYDASEHIKNAIKNKQIYVEVV